MLESLKRSCLFPLKPLKAFEGNPFNATLCETVFEADVCGCAPGVVTLGNITAGARDLTVGNIRAG